MGPSFLRRRLGGKGLDVARLLGVVEDALVRVRLDDLLDVEADDVLSCGVLLLVSSWTPFHSPTAEEAGLCTEHRNTYPYW